jgi:nucleotide-binding universal stress UspA family protein
VWEPPGYVGPDALALLPVSQGTPGWEQTRTDVAREAEHFLAKAAARPAHLSVHVQAGEPSDTILRVAQDGGADLIVMGTHGWSGLLRWMLGSVAHHVIQAGPRPPVLTVAPHSLAPENRDVA